jgi:alkanesulfonate monooxygenase SsuD/methylene tetrahydromethanopterin reductase-like flavin-dependent oxidoreductase (luciferase family)
MGLAVPPTAERFEDLEDTLRLALRMWAGDETAFVGSRHTVARPVHGPPPVTEVFPPILIGGGGERTTLRLVARYAQACSLPDVGGGGASIRHKLGVLAGHCADAGRPYEDIDKTVGTALGPDESPDALVERCAAFAGLGIEHVIVSTPGPWTGEAVIRLATTVPAVRELSATRPARTP